MFAFSMTRSKKIVKYHFSTIYKEHKMLYSINILKHNIACRYEKDIKG